MKEHCRIATWFAGCALALLSVGCSPQPAPDTRAADESAIREADIAWSNAAVAKQLDTILPYYTDDASIYPANAPMATGKDAIRKVWEQLVQLPGFSVHWQPTQVEAARSGDLGYSRGTYEMTMNDPKGNPVTDRGKYVVVWKKEADGKWRAVADIFNSDLPPAPAK